MGARGAKVVVLKPTTSCLSEYQLWVRSAVPHDCPARQEYPNDRTRRPAKAASPSGQKRALPALLDTREIGVSSILELPTGRAEVP
jgi:hypothetical protein